MAHWRTGSTKGFEATTLYQRVFALAEQQAGHPLPRALVPRIKLGGPENQAQPDHRLVRASRRRSLQALLGTQ